MSEQTPPYPPQPHLPEEYSSLLDPYQTETQHKLRSIPKIPAPPAPPMELLAAPLPSTTQSLPWWKSHPVLAALIIALIIAQIIADIVAIASIHSLQAQLSTTRHPTSINHNLALSPPPTNITSPNTNNTTTQPTTTPKKASSPISIQARPSPTPTPTPKAPLIPTTVDQTIVDNLNDWNTTYSHSDDLIFDVGNGQRFGGDISRAYRKTSLHDEIVWHLPNISKFTATTFFWTTESVSPFSLYTSADGLKWTIATPTISAGPNGANSWQGYVYTLDHLSGTNYIKMYWNNMTGNSWSPQISQAVIHN